jgi:hypothetical protein
MERENHPKTARRLAVMRAPMGAPERAREKKFPRRYCPASALAKSSC